MSRRNRRLLRIAAPLAGALLALLSARPTPLQAQEGSAAWLEQCRESRNDRSVHCEVRVTTLTGIQSLDVNAGPNGGASVRGWDGADVRIEARIQTRATSDARAREIASNLRVETAGGRVRADGPSTGGRESWTVSYDIRVPRRMNLAMRTTNGGLALTDVAGTMVLHTTNGGIALTNVGGDVRGETSNGGLRVRLAGNQWSGTGLDLRTNNGGISLSLPESYGADLAVSTVNGGFRSDIPTTVLTRSGRRFEARLGGGGPPIRLTTTNGGVRIERD